ncbi:MAG: hypothetical protein J5522_08345 [Lachnospiraceae bacterium]|nr:hypothetical protein [Lachnospiraceae bacterium]
MVTWKDIKYATLQKMFSITGSQTEIPSDSATMEYVNAMPQACNEALELLATAGKFIIKEYMYFNYPFDNLLKDAAFKTETIVNDTKTYEAIGAQSYYFKIQGTPKSCKLFIGEEEVTDFEVDNVNFVVYKGNVPYTGEEEDTTVRLIIEADSPVFVSNVCFYGCKFASDDVVPQYENFIRLELSKILPDFYQLAPAELYSLGYTGNDYIVADKYFQEADKTLVIPREKQGIYIIHYRAYPQFITLDTPDEEEMALDPEVAAIIPLYMASQLYKDDDLSTSTVYRNEWEVAFEKLSQGALVPKKEKFIPSSGWA